MSDTITYTPVSGDCLACIAECGGNMMFGHVAGCDRSTIQRVIEFLIQASNVALLESLAAKADKEYNRGEVDNWLFSLGCLTHDALLNHTKLTTPKKDA